MSLTDIERKIKSSTLPDAEYYQLLVSNATTIVNASLTEPKALLATKLNMSSPKFSITLKLLIAISQRASNVTIN